MPDTPSLRDQSNEQTCSYCGREYPAPVELHHTETECAAPDAPDLMAALIDSLERFRVRFVRDDDTVGEQHYSTIGAAKAGQVKLAAVGINSHLYQRNEEGWTRVEG